MRDGNLGVVQGESVPPLTVGQEIVGKLMAGDIVGLGGGIHMDRNLTGREFVFFNAGAAYSDVLKYCVKVDTRWYGEDSHGSGQDFVSRKGTCDRSDLLPFLKEYKGSKEDGVLDWLAIGEGECFIHERFLGGEHPCAVLRGALEICVAMAWKGLEFYTGEGTVPDMRSLVMFGGNFDADQRVLLQILFTLHVKAESYDWWVCSPCYICRGDKTEEEQDGWCYYIVDEGFVGFDDGCMFMKSSE